MKQFKGTIDRIEASKAIIIVEASLKEYREGDSVKISLQKDQLQTQKNKKTGQRLLKKILKEK